MHKGQEETSEDKTLQWAELRNPISVSFGLLVHKHGYRELAALGSRNLTDFGR
jgi:hypothetical protein